jgi:antitoxin YefM
MTTISYTSVRGNLASTMKRVCEDHDPVIITRQNAEPVVMLSLDDYESLCETNYLLQSPENAKRLIDSVTELNAGKGKIRELLK